MTIQCDLCPKVCVLKENQRGNCRARVNIGGKLRTITYGHPCSIHVDPIEKKPLFHFLPGTQALSLACAGCNLHCKNCQNWDISQSNPEDVPAYTMSPEEVVDLAKREKAPTIAFTYSDPAIFFEYSLDIAGLAKDQGIKSAFITAGYLNREPLKKILGVLDAIKVDFKFFDDAMYREITTATLQPVLDTMVLAKEMGVWLEVVHLIIPTLNDQPAKLKELCGWVKTNLGSDTPLHFSRFYPQYLLRNLPQTPENTLLMAKDIAKEAGLNFIYIGNIYSGDWENTYCPIDNTLLVKRQGYLIAQNNIKDGKCPSCGKVVPGVWR